ncbi:LytR/AlgR family response regulator transcription factor [Flavobacterium gelatinilyticum]|uniref:LytR/AlgR family response regulator transcription factor n=1 Tax=Flavobacterium gelatinilyticum TaxID=3003260 RepID=UPI00248131F2|nr:LytTR family DNA-binding domain-containing protein [Flavobacterium gelatinilyticum]
MKILIIEDEGINTGYLERLFKELEPGCEILAIIGSVKAAVDYLEANPAPDLITMDVKLSDGLCFSIFDQVNIACPVIFTADFEQYAIRAFKVNSIDYLLKPVKINELEFAIKKFKALSEIKKPTAGFIEILMDKIQKKVYRSRFFVAARNGYQTINVADIDFIYSEFKITNLFLKTEEIIPVSYTMEKIEKELDPDIFFRANRQFFIRAESIKSVTNSFNSKLKIVLKMDKGREVIISREKAPSFKKWMDC